MKTLIKNLTKSILPILVIAIAGCDDNDENLPTQRIVTDEIITVPLFVVDGNGNAPTGPETMLFEIRELNPVVDTEGKQLSFEEFSTVRGTAIIEGIEGGTRVSLNLTGLVPNGLYTLWNVTFKEPGFDPSLEDMNLIGLGVVGKNDGSESYFRASPTGTGQITAFTPEGPLSMMGGIAAHPFSQEVEWHLVGSYHMDDQTHGPDLGPDGTVVEQFAFIFKPENN